MFCHLFVIVLSFSDVLFFDFKTKMKNDKKNNAKKMHNMSKNDKNVTKIKKSKNLTTSKFKHLKSWFF